MTRTRRTAKNAGTSFETLIANYMAVTVDDRIERRTKTGAKDRGDISGLRHMGQRVVVECKNTAALKLSEWAKETEIERGNDDALAGVIVHKAHGKGAATDQWVTMTVRDFTALLTGEREE